MTEPTPAPRLSSGADRHPGAAEQPRPVDAADIVDSGTDVAAAAVSAVATAGDRLAAAAGVPSTDFATELNNIDFGKMISGPLQAAVDAQVLSSLATIDFINRVGFTNSDGAGPPRRELVMVDFSHQRKEIDSDGNEVSKAVDVRVPLLAMLPIPSLRIEHVVVDFNAKLNSVESSSTSEELGIGAELGVAWGPVNFKVSASYQRKTVTSVQVEREYSLKVNVKAVQDEMPAGLERILGMLAA